MVGNQVTVSHLLLKNLNLLQFPLVGQVTIRDNRTTCGSAPGPCQVTVDFTFELVQYETPCPGDLRRFTSAQHTAVDWTVPVVRKPSGLSESLIGSYEPGAHMTLGTTLVEYAHAMHPSQLPGAHITCNFSVCGSYARKYERSFDFEFILL
jgi:hypothetical protein